MSFTVSKFPSDQDGCGWYNILPAPSPARELDSDIGADWVIVGAGFAGLSAAHRIRQQSPEDRVVVIDAQRVGWGAAGRNSGFMIDLPHNVQSDDYSGEGTRDQQEMVMNRFAIDYARSMINEFGLQEHISDIGKINAATSHSGVSALESYSSHLNRLGEPFTKLDRDALKDITGTDYYHGGIHTPGCLLFQPAAYIRGVAEGLLPGIELYENSPVIKIETENANDTSYPSTRRTKKVVTENGSVTAKNIILTVNGHLESFGIYQKRFMHIFLYGSMTRELTASEQQTLGGHAEWGITPANPLGSTVRKMKQGRIVVRNHITYNPQRASSDAQLSTAGEKHDLAFQRRFPMLKDVEMEHRWSGHLCLSLNSVPVFGEIENGIFAACCQNGLGAVKGTLNGILIADHALGIKDEKTQSMIEDAMACKAPKKLYPEPFMSVGAKSRLWWGQIRAGRDL